jgi:anti-sigma B factor antagonist
MYQTQAAMSVRKAGDQASVIDIRGGMTASAETALMDAYAQASDGAGSVRAVILDFSDLEYMNSSGIGLLVRVLKQAERDGHRLLAFGLNEHYRRVLELTGLNDFIQVHGTESEALAGATGADL